MNALMNCAGRRLPMRWLSPFGVFPQHPPSEHGPGDDADRIRRGGIAASRASAKGDFCLSTRFLRASRPSASPVPATARGNPAGQGRKRVGAAGPLFPSQTFSHILPSPSCYCLLPTQFLRWAFPPNYPAFSLPLSPPLSPGSYMLSVSLAQRLLDSRHLPCY